MVYSVVFEWSLMSDRCFSPFILVLLRKLSSLPCSSCCSFSINTDIVNQWDVSFLLILNTEIIYRSFWGLSTASQFMREEPRSSRIFIPTTYTPPCNVGSRFHPPTQLFVYTCYYHIRSWSSQSNLLWPHISHHSHHFQTSSLAVAAPLQVINRTPSIHPFIRWF